MSPESGRARAPSPVAAAVLAFVVLVEFCFSSWVWPLMGDAAMAKRPSYRAVWQERGFRGLPIDDVANALNKRLPLETPIRLGPGAAANDQWAQRFKEGLYPRRVRADAPVTLDLTHGPASGAILTIPQGSFVLSGALPPAPASPVPGTANLELSWLLLALQALSAFGWGASFLIMLAWLRRGSASDAGPTIGGATVAAAAIYAVLGTAATLVQRSLPWQAISITGVVLALAAAAHFTRQMVAQKTLGGSFAWTRRAEVWLALAFSALVLWHVAVWPIIGWDGRSIWLYRAKQMAYPGYLSSADATNLENFFSHMEYPLLFPSWLIQFAGFGVVHERQMSMGAPLLFLGLFSCLWVIGRRRLGRWTGAAFAGAVMFAGVGSIGRGYADSYVSMFLLIMIFCLESEDLEPLGWAAALATTLTKREGLVVAMVAAALFTIFHPRSRARRWLPRFAPALVFVPALAHVLWTRAIGIKDTHAGAKLPTTAAVLFERLGVIGSGIMNFERQVTTFAFGTAAMLSYLVLEAAGWRSWRARIFAWTGFAVIAFSIVAMLASPYDLAWQVSTALDRVLGHATLLFFASVLVALGSPDAPELLGGEDEQVLAVRRRHAGL